MTQLIVSLMHTSFEKSLIKLVRPLVLILGILCITMPSMAIKVTRVSWDPPGNGYNKFTIQFDEMPKYNVVDSLEKSNFFYLDFYGLQQNYKRRLLDIDNDPVLKYVDALSFSDKEVLRMVFYARQPGAKFHIETKAQPPTIIVYTIGAGGKLPASVMDVSVSAVPTSATQLAQQTSAPGTANNAQPQTNTGAVSPGQSTQVGFQIPSAPQSQEKITRQHSSGKKYIIIDPGHGGANGGAKSDIKIGGRILDEKELTIKFAYELKKLIDTHPGMVGLLTRVDDTNVGLYERVKIAEENKGDAGNLFISFHLNDAPNNPAARGMEVYFLNQKGTVDAAVREIEEKENREVGLKSGGKGKSMLTNVLTALEQGKLEDWQLESYIFCKRLEQSLVSDPYFALHNRGVKNANFVVLKNFEMPAVLLEIGFISNSTELKNMIQPEFQQMTATLVYNAVNAYFAENDPSFQPRYIAPRRTQFP